MLLIEKIIAREAHIAVIGLGYVGLPLVIEFCRAGFHVAGFDVDAEKVAMLKQGKSYIKHIDPSLLANDFKDRFQPTSDFSLLQSMDCVIICVPTPLNKNREPDMQYVFNTTQTIAENLQKGQLIVRGLPMAICAKSWKEPVLRQGLISILPFPRNVRIRIIGISVSGPYPR